MVRSALFIGRKNGQRLLVSLGCYIIREDVTVAQGDSHFSTDPTPRRVQECSAIRFQIVDSGATVCSAGEYIHEIKKGTWSARPVLQGYNRIQKFFLDLNAIIYV